MRFILLLPHPPEINWVQLRFKQDRLERYFRLVMGDVSIKAMGLASKEVPCLALMDQAQLKKELEHILTVWFHA